MRLRPLIFLMVLFSLAGTAGAHVSVIIPRLFSAEELSRTRLVLINPDVQVASVKLALTGDDGTVISVPEDLIVGPSHQTIKPAAELFPGTRRGGWITMFTAQEELQIAWFLQNDPLTGVDGAEAAGFDSFNTEQVIPFVTRQTEVHVINPGRYQAPLKIHLFGPDGEMAKPFLHDLPPGGGFRSEVSAMFAGVDLAKARYVRVETIGAFISSSAVVRGYPGKNDFSIINGVKLLPRKELTFPRLAASNSGFTTIIGVSNLSESGQDFSFTFHPEKGAPMTVVRKVAGNGALREPAETLFQLPPGNHNGWLTISAAVSMMGFAAYADKTAGGVFVVPPGGRQIQLFFPGVFHTGLDSQPEVVLLNSNDSVANAELYAIDASGTLLGKSSITLEPGARVSGYLADLVPQTRNARAAWMYMRAVNGQPLYGMEFLRAKDSSIWSNVPVRGSIEFIYRPPSP